MTDPTVVLVSVGADSAALIDEIEKKGLRVVSCPFADAEEAIEREKPLLVVLHGARGAVELSTMLEDAVDPPQVAVVAARADLGTLMGLNRDIVVSLLATELTEKTVAARLEAVARQRAKTLGLTLNLAARRMSLGPRPSLPRPPPTQVSTGTSAPNLVLEAPTPDVLAAAKTPPGSAVAPAHPGARASRLQGGTAIGLPAAPGRPEPPPVPQRPRPAEPFPLAAPGPTDQLSQSLLLSEIPEPAKPPGPPPRPAPPRPVGTPEPPTALESDSPVAESISPSSIESLEPREPTTTAVIAPLAPALPRFEPSELLAESGLDESIGPELRAALPFRSPEPELPSAPLLPKVGPDTGTADTEDVLEAHPHRPPTPDLETLPPPPPRDEDDEDLALPLLRPSRPPLQDATSDDFGATMLAEVTMPAIPGSLAAEALALARLKSEPNHPIPEPPPVPAGDDDDDDRATVTGDPSPYLQVATVQSAPIQPPLPLATEKPANRSWAGAAVLLLAVGAGASYIKWGMPKPPTPSVSGEPEPSVPAADTLTPPPPVTESAEPALAAAPSEPSAIAPAEASAAAAAEAAPTPSATPTAEEPAPEEPATPAEPTPTAATTPPATAASAAPATTSAGTTEPAVLLDNPFATPDANLPGCEVLAPGARPTPGDDPIAEASEYWAQARKGIVKGDIEGAARAMCTAVAINPQSPAAEGLARLYTLAHSSAQALTWVDRAIQLAPSNRELLLLRGDAKSQLGRQEEAVSDWLEAMGIKPDETKRRTSQAAEYANVAREEKARSDFAKAEQFYRRALGFEETNLIALTGMAETLYARKLYDQAGTFAVRALAVFEPVPEAYLVLGDVAVAKNDPARARAAFERALAIRPDFWPAKKRLRELPK